MKLQVKHLELIRLTNSRTSSYDNYMLWLHDITDNFKLYGAEELVKALDAFCIERGIDRWRT